MIYIQLPLSTFFYNEAKTLKGMCKVSNETIVAKNTTTLRLKSGGTSLTMVVFIQNLGILAMVIILPHW